LDSVGCIYRMDRMLSQELVPYQVIPKEKKKVDSNILITYLTITIIFVTECI
jgi:hypothetical protein